MNNKLIARVVAGAMAVAMLGTVSFAAKVSGNKDTVTSGTITTDGYANQATKTFMAFATDTKDATAPGNDDIIIALGQESELPGAIPVEPAKLDKNYVVVIHSGTEGIKATSTIDVSKLERTFTLDTALANEVIGKNENGEEVSKYTNVACAEFEFPVKDSTLKKVGISYTKGTKSVDVAVEGAEFTGTGNVKYAAVLYNVTATDIDGMTAVPFAVYADYVEE